MSELVWFKKDLRVADHAALLSAARRGSTVCLYVYETEMMESPEHDPSHQIFINQSLIELAQKLEDLGGTLLIRRGQLPDVLENLHTEYAFQRIWAHEETGLMWTYKRDLRVHEWARKKGVKLLEIPQNGVVRRLKSRNGWAKQWNSRMMAQPLPIPKSISGPKLSGTGVLELSELGLQANEKTEAVLGGETEALGVLKSFLQSRGEHYRGSLSSPVTAWDACSRLSPYFTWGNISLRQVVWAAARRQKQARGAWRASLEAFKERLYWHCHFIQKLEDEPEIEFQNVNRGFDGMREDQFDQQYFRAWCEGRTGYPLVDAVMRCLQKGGWINFRMRAMLVSFASYHLWLHWREPAVFLSRHFLDFEPGIHFAQFQMQAGTTGINATRIYNPVKQMMEQDPQGEFVRRYLPELQKVEVPALFEPHKMSREQQELADCIIGEDYPLPIVDNLKAQAIARKRLAAWEKRPEVRRLSRLVQQRHGSRRGAISRH